MERNERERAPSPESEPEPLVAYPFDFYMNILIEELDLMANIIRDEKKEEIIPSTPIMGIFHEEFD